MSVSLKDGHIQYEIHYRDDDNPIVLTSDLKYNTGKKVRVSIAKKYFNKADTANMRIEMMSNYENLNRTKTNVQRNAMLKIKKCKFYFGGVPPNYTANYLDVTRALHTHQSLLGEIDEVISHQSIALMDNSDESKGYYGIVETKCNEVRIFFLLACLRIA